ncbi:MAG: hypothetical protein AABN33_18405 [Acidobacteriota bacterium]
MVKRGARTRKLSGKQALCLLMIYFLLVGVCWLKSGPLPLFIPPGSLVVLAMVFTNAGKAITTNRLKGSGTEPNYVAIGTGAGTAVITDTTLFTEVETRVAGTSTQQTTTVTNDTYQSVGTIAITATRAITNAGLFDASSAGNLLIKGDFATINLVGGDSIQITGKLAFS